MGGYSEINQSRLLSMQPQQQQQQQQQEEHEQVGSLSPQKKR
jgi:hypothetical protein